MKTEVLRGQGYVELQASYGDDLAIVNNARQSFNVEHQVLTKADVGLIHSLMRDRHGTPFEVVDFRFRVKCPLTVAREWLRHRMASYNEMSGRYMKLPKEWYLHPSDYIRTQTGKPNQYVFEKMPIVEALFVQDLLDKHYKKCWFLYEELLDIGVAREVARSVLPQAMMTQFTFKTNLRSLFNFISLRSDETAMQEIREYSQAMEPMIASVVPEAYNAFVKTGRTAP